MAFTLYGLGPSRSFRCLWALEEAGLEYDFVSLDLSSTGENGAKSQEYLALNQQGKVPTLVHKSLGDSEGAASDFVLTESAAILNYISAVSDKEFIPTEPKSRARYDELAFFVLAELEQPLWTTGKHRFAIPEEHRVPEVLETAQWEFKKALKALNSLCDLHASPCSEGGYALGAEFSFADILLAQTFNWADRFKFDLPSELLAYRDSLYARDAAMRALKHCE